MIGHRLSTVENVDEIFVIDKGKVLESRNHMEILKKSGKYASRWKEYQTVFIWNALELEDNG